MSTHNLRAMAGNVKDVGVIVIALACIHSVLDSLAWASLCLGSWSGAGHPKVRLHPKIAVNAAARTCAKLMKQGNGQGRSKKLSSTCNLGVAGATFRP